MEVAGRLKKEAKLDEKEVIQVGGGTHALREQLRDFHDANSSSTMCLLLYLCLPGYL